jgi:hypothetical protein
MSNSEAGSTPRNLPSSGSLCFTRYVSEMRCSARMATRTFGMVSYPRPGGANPDLAILEARRLDYRRSISQIIEEVWGFSSRVPQTRLRCRILLEIGCSRSRLKLHLQASPVFDSLIPSGSKRKDRKGRAARYHVSSKFSLSRALQKNPMLAVIVFDVVTRQRSKRHVS